MPMDPVSEIDFIRSREVNVPASGFKGALRELFREGPLTILFAAGVGAAIGGLVLGGAALLGTSVMGAGMSALTFVGLAAGASAALTTAFVATRGFLEGRRDGLEKNQLIDHMANLHKGEIAMRGAAVQQEIQQSVDQKEGHTPAFLKKILDGGRRGNPMRHAETLAQEVHDQGDLGRG